MVGASWSQLDMVGASRGQLDMVGASWSQPDMVGASFSSKKWFCLCDGNFVFSRDVILKEVSELNGIVRIIVRSDCKQF